MLSNSRTLVTLPLLLLWSCSSDPGGLLDFGLLDARGTGSEGGPGQEGGARDGATAVADGQGDASTTPVAPFSFVVFGDNQFATTSCTSGIPERLAIPQAILGLSPTMVLHTGDLMDHGYDAGAYEAFAGCYKGMLAKHPFFPTIGNHDAGTTGILNYKKYLEQQLLTENPKVYGGTYGTDFTVSYNDDPTKYSTDFGNPTMTAVVPSGVSFKTFYAYRHRNAYFISFEQGTRWWSNTPKTWLEQHLKAARADATIQHVFVHLHHPIYSTTMQDTSDSECTAPVRQQYEPLFRKYNVTMVFSGHAHIYEHFYVPDDGSPTRQVPGPKAYAQDGSAVHYIVTGGGGGPLPNGCNPIPAEKQQTSYPFTQGRNCGYHVTRVEVSGKKLTVSIVAVKGSAQSHTTTVWESFTIE